MSDPQTILVERRDGVQLIRFHRPEKKNALTNAMYHRIADAMAQAEADPAIGAHLFVGSNGVFTAGNDIADFAGQGKPAIPEGERGVSRFLMAQIDATKPMVAAVDGLAVGIGTTLLLQCDLVFASERARMIAPFTDLALLPENASSMLAPRIMGHQRAFELLCLGEPFDAAQAHLAGFVNRILPADELESHAVSVAARLAAKPREAMRISRALLRADPERVRARSVEESRLFAERLRSDEARAVFAAFLARYRP